MISIATLDPSSLALWIDLSQMSSSPVVPYADNLLGFGLRSSVSGDFISKIPDRRVAGRCAQIVSSIWHEKRHFLDLLLTNYGAFRVRQFFELYVNLGELQDFRRNQEYFHCPIDIYADPVLCRLRGIHTVPERLALLAGAMKRRRQTLQSDKVTLETSSGTVQVGGEAQLEALALFFQVAASQHLLGDATLWQHELPSLENRTRYHWATLLGETMGIVPTRKMPNGSVVSDCSLLIPILYSSLMMRAWGQQQVEPRIGTSGLPSNRLAGMLDAFDGFRFEFGSIAIDEAWRLVNQKANELWGRTVIEELTIDYEHEEAHFDRIASMESVPLSVRKAMRDFHTLRGKVIGLLVDSPTLILDGDTFSSDLLPNLNPLVVHAVPSGVYGDVPRGFRHIFGYKHLDYDGTDGTWWWAAARDGSGGLRLANTDAWIDIVSEVAPLAKLMMNGRRHKTILGPEIIVVEQRLKTIGPHLRVDPLFAFPERDDSIENLYYLQMRDSMVCDFCHSSMQRPSGRLLSPWVFRFNTELASLAVSALGGGVRGELKFLKDWSFWALCDSCGAALFQDTCQ